jgi:hypothetical protein
MEAQPPQYLWKHNPVGSGPIFSSREFGRLQIENVLAEG